MARHSTSQTFDAIQNGEEDVLFYYTDKYYQPGRRLLRRMGCKDADTPEVFSKVLVKIYREIQQKKFSTKIDFDTYFVNSLKEYFRNDFTKKNSENLSMHDLENDVVISCFSIMSEGNRKVLALRYAEELSFEQIAVRLDFSNPVIAEFELNKAFIQFENIAKARLLIQYDESISKNDRLLIERFIHNNLTGSELKDFHDRMDSNEAFRKNVGLVNLLVEGIREAEEQRLIKKIENYIGYSQPFIPFSLKLIFTFLITTAVGIALWNYLGPGSTGKKRNYTSLDWFQPKQKNNVDLIQSDQKYLTEKKQDIVAADINRESSNIKNSNEPVAPTDSLNEEIVVKKDQLLISINMEPFQLEKENKPDQSNSDDIADLLNPGADLPDESDSKRNSGYVVEFWVSPVNYKGYKLIDGKLILFGIDEPDAVRLYSKNEDLWMKYGSEFFKLEPTEQFESLIASTEKPNINK